jgi:voltage-gated potassium channel
MKLPDKERIYKIIFETDTKAGKAFDVTLIIAIIISILVIIIESTPFVTGKFKTFLSILEYVLTFFFTLEYALRIYCSPNPRSYIFSFFGIVDLIATLPLYLGFILPVARYVLIIRAFRLIRVFRVFKLFNFINEGHLLLKSIRRSFSKIFVFFLFVLILVISIGTLMYMIEGNIPGSHFKDIPTSIYWAVVTLTTVGYGDITPVTDFGRFLSAIVMLLGYTIIAVPTGIVSASIIDETNKKGKNNICPRCGGETDTNANYCKHCGERL